MIIIVSFMGICLPKGLNLTCTLIAIGMSIGNIASAIYLYMLFLFERKNGYKSGYSRNNKYRFLKIFSLIIISYTSRYKSLFVGELLMPLLSKSMTCDRFNKLSANPICKNGECELMINCTLGKSANNFGKISF